MAIPIDMIGMAGWAAIRYSADQALLVNQLNESIEWLKRMLASFNHNYYDRMNSELRQQWQEVGYDGQDILEEFAVWTSSHQNLLVYYQKYKFGQRIKALGDKVQSLRDIDDFQPQRPSPERSPRENNQLRLRRPHILPDQFQPVGMDSQIQAIADLLVGTGPKIIATVGMGGVGKTRLLQHVFKKSTIDLKIWLSVSQQFSVREVQSEIAKRIWDYCSGDSHLALIWKRLKLKFRFTSTVTFFNTFDQEREETRACRIGELLQGFPSSLIVLDNIWSTEEGLLEQIGLPVGTNSTCKILISTRSREVLEAMKAHPVEVDSLSEEDSRKLFFCHASTNNRFPEELKEVAHCIVDECKGLPLAIETTGKAMANVKKHVNNWKAKLEEIKKVGVLGNVLPILKLSFDPMPNHVKHLFLYWSFFHKEDKNIDREYLISLWLAENLISLGQAERLTSRAREQDPLNFLEQLYNACLIEKQEDIEKEKNFCRMHDLLRYLCMCISKEDNWVFDPNGKDSTGNPLVQSSHCRRLSVPKMDISSFPRRIKCSSALRALSLSGNQRITDIAISFFKDIKVLRVLDVSGTSITCLPKYLKKMKLLRVLNISGTKIKKLPGCVRRLRSLQLLDISRCIHLETLPKWVRELEELRHLSILDANISFPFSHLPRGLLVLRGVNTRPLEVAEAKHLGNLQEVQLVLKQNNEMFVQNSDFFNHIKQVKGLSLFTNENGFLPLLPLLTDENGNLLSSAKISMHNLQKLHIEGFEVPNCIADFKCLEFLRLCRCKYEKFPPLQRMHSLRKLELTDNDSHTELPELGYSNGFPNLEWLKICSFTMLKSLPEREDEAMKSLQSMVVENCSHLQIVPEGWRNVLRN